MPDHTNSTHTERSHSGPAGPGQRPPLVVVLAELLMRVTTLTSALAAVLGLAGGVAALHAGAFTVDDGLASGFGGSLLVQALINGGIAVLAIKTAVALRAGQQWARLVLTAAVVSDVLYSSVLPSGLLVLIALLHLSVAAALWFTEPARRHFGDPPLNPGPGTTGPRSPLGPCPSPSGSPRPFTPRGPAPGPQPTRFTAANRGPFHPGPGPVGPLDAPTLAFAPRPARPTTGLGVTPEAVPGRP